MFFIVLDLPVQWVDERQKARSITELRIMKSEGMTSQSASTIIARWTMNAILPSAVLATDAIVSL